MYLHSGVISRVRNLAPLFTRHLCLHTVVVKYVLAVLPVCIMTLDVYQVSKTEVFAIPSYF